MSKRVHHERPPALCWNGLLLLAAVTLCLPALLSAADSPQAKSWTDKIKISGDFRYRHEYISDMTGTAAKKVRTPDFNRQRLRLRLGVQATVNDAMTVNMRLATSTFLNGTGSPVSTNQDLGSGFGEKPFWLDRAYLDYHPVKQFTARAGRFQVPYDGTDLVWSPDLVLEGMTVLPSVRFDNTELYLGSGGFWAADRKSADGPAQGLFVEQVGASSASGQLGGLLSLAYIDYGNVKNGPTLYNATKGMGNTVHVVAGNTYYDNDFNMVDIYGQAQYKTEHVDYTLLLDAVRNIATASDSANTGWLAGFTLKFHHLPVDWDFAYNYRALQADAVMGMYCDPLTGGGGTNVSGHKVSAYVNVMTGSRLGICYMDNLKDPSHAHLNYRSVLVDLEAKF